MEINSLISNVGLSHADILLGCEYKSRSRVVKERKQRLQHLIPC